MIAEIVTYYGGHWAKPRIEIAEIIPEYFKNGSMKRTVFRTVRIIEVKQKGYQPKGSRESSRIERIIEEEAEV